MQMYKKKSTLCCQCLIYVISILFITGCATTPKDPYSGQPTGLLIGSIGVTAVRASEPNRKAPNFSAFFDVFPLSAAESEKIVTLSSAQSLDTVTTLIINSPIILVSLAAGVPPPPTLGFPVYNGSQFKGQNGQVFAMKLPVGSYVIKEGRLDQQDAGTNIGKGDPYSLEVAPLTFELKQDEALYIGNIDVQASGWQYNSKIRRYSIEGISVAIRDQRQRDLPLIRDKLEETDGPNIDVNNIKTIDFQKIQSGNIMGSTAGDN